MDARFEGVFWQLRLPRVLLGVAVGAAWSVAGALIQGLFRNPLADPGLIGLSSGAALGAVFVIVLGGLVLPNVPGVGVCVAFTGMIGFVGLVVPHLVRLWIGPDDRWLLPGSALLGAFILTLADTFARTIVVLPNFPSGRLQRPSADPHSCLCCCASAARRCGIEMSQPVS